MKELITEYTTLQENVLNSGTDNPYMDEETRQYFKTKSREITELIQQKLPKRENIERPDCSAFLLSILPEPVLLGGLHQHSQNRRFHLE